LVIRKLVHAWLFSEIMNIMRMRLSISDVVFFMFIELI